MENALFHGGFLRICSLSRKIHGLSFENSWLLLVLLATISRYYPTIKKEDAFQFYSCNTWHIYHHHVHTQPFYGPFSGTTQVSLCQKRTSELCDARED